MNISSLSRPAVPAAAVAYGVLTLGVNLARVPLDSLTHQSGPGGPVADGLGTAVLAVPVVAVGTLLAARRPRNPIGWVLLTIVLLGNSPVWQYSVLDYRMHHGSGQLLAQSGEQPADLVAGQRDQLAVVRASFR